ncbi:hypothetical protein AMAG_04133 [Allomyces macrogynus ATCC 38327]|uniref:Uncharacterized protein n=1 Tax=Allomyces macrogynus (strain ATCC 38327) TaxID=578462 RepID=A0A0L0S890_ALLM3|nr:hypothetical protein AMAG_04133 [Allomyces macrogynus ATCC 38327]|eukprot:KNE58569.1 hypothetical protein AMAG_04133 [Allomyces macrogynus ATCC 38327]
MVVWSINLSSTRDALFVTGAVIQSVSFFLLVWNLVTVISHWLRSRSGFWTWSLVGSVLLMPVPLFEISYVLSRLSNGTLWPFPAYTTIIGDCFVRTGYAIITICRFFRLRLVSPLRKRHSKHIFFGASALVVVLMAMCITSSFILRLEENKFPVGSKPSQHLLDLRRTDRFVNLTGVMGTSLMSLATDLLFYVVVVRSTTESRGHAAIAWQTKARVLMPYAPPIFVAVAYIVCLFLSVFAPTIPSMLFTANTLGKFVPVVDAFVFFRYSIDQTKSLLQSLSSSHGTTNGGTSTTNPNAAGAWYSSTSHLGGGPGSTTYPDYSRPYQVDADLPGKPSAGGPLAGPFHSYPAAPAPRNIEYAPYPVPPEGAVAYPMPAAGGRQVHGNALFPSLSRNKEPSMAISQPMTRYNVQSGANGAQLVRSLSQSRRDSAANVRPGAPAGSYYF